MGRSRLVKPDTTRLPISDGDWVVVKRTLNYGEHRAMWAASRTPPVGDDPTAGRYDSLEAGRATLVAYLVDWSLSDAEPALTIRGKSPHEVRAILDAIEDDSAIEILRVIEAHQRTIAAERTAEKNATPDGATPSAATLASPFAATGR